MKGMLIGCTCMILALLLGVTLSSPAGWEPCTTRPAVVTAPTPVQAYELMIWADWIRSSPRRRPYRNPLRRYRLSKKQRRCLRQRLWRLLERHTPAALGQESPIEAGDGLPDSGRGS